MEPVEDKIEPFHNMLTRHGLTLTRTHTSTLQINVGRMCNQTCRHCHLDAGPTRKEIMAPQIMDRVVAYAQKVPFEVIDINKLLSVAWDGYLYDCDFNQAAGLAAGTPQKHIDQLTARPVSGSVVNCANHCYTCTAGAGFT